MGPAPGPPGSGANMKLAKQGSRRVGNYYQEILVVVWLACCPEKWGGWDEQPPQGGPWGLCGPFPDDKSFLRSSPLSSHSTARTLLVILESHTNFLLAMNLLCESCQRSMSNIAIATVTMDC